MVMRNSIRQAMIKLDLPTSLRERLAAFLEEKDVSETDFIIDILEEYLEKQEIEEERKGDLVNKLMRNIRRF